MVFFFLIFLLLIIRKRPKKFLFKKSFRKYLSNSGFLQKTSSYKLTYGDFGIKCLENHWLRYIHFQLIRLAIIRSANRKPRIWFRYQLQTPVTRHTRNARMGKGKGVLKSFTSGIYGGSILVEFSGPSSSIANNIFYKLKKILPSRILLIRNLIRCL